MVIWTPKSHEDLDEIWDHVAQNFNSQLASDTVEDIINYVETTLNKNPLAGGLLESNPLFSKLNYKGNSIFYVENPKDKILYVVYVQARRTKLSTQRFE